VQHDVVDPITAYNNLAVLMKSFSQEQTGHGKILNEQKTTILYLRSPETIGGDQNHLMSTSSKVEIIFQDLWWRWVMVCVASWSCLLKMKVQISIFELEARQNIPGWEKYIRTTIPLPNSKSSREMLTLTKSTTQAPLITFKEQPNL
jgi:hypothetical protein